MTTGEVIALIKAFGGGGGSSGGGGVLVVNDVSGTLDKTWQEIHDALLVGSVLVVVEDVVGVTQDIVNNVTENHYAVKTISDGQYRASSASGYPAWYESGGTA